MKFHTKLYNNTFDKLYGPNMHGAQMYYITPKFAKLLLINSLPITNHIDHWIGLNLYKYNVNAYILKHNLYSIDKFLLDNMNSSINHNTSYKMFLPSSNSFPVICICIYCFYFLILFIILFFMLKK